MNALFVCVWFIACTDVLQMSINRIPSRERDKTALLLTCVTRMAHTNLPTNPLWVREVPRLPITTTHAIPTRAAFMSSSFLLITFLYQVRAWKGCCRCLNGIPFISIFRDRNNGILWGWNITNWCGVKYSNDVEFTLVWLVQLPTNCTH